MKEGEHTGTTFAVRQGCIDCRDIPICLWAASPLVFSVPAHLKESPEFQQSSLRFHRIPGIAGGCRRAERGRWVELDRREASESVASGVLYLGFEREKGASWEKNILFPSMCHHPTSAMPPRVFLRFTRTVGCTISDRGVLKSAPIVRV